MFQKQRSGGFLERPSVTGLAVPGMPVGSPGMEVDGSPAEEYTVFLFGAFGKRPFETYRGGQKLSG